MKKFEVVRQADSTATTVTEIVKADYVLYPMGMLVFKKEVYNSYPEIVKIYAEKNWFRVTLVVE